MSYWQLRETIESHIPWWAIIVPMGMMMASCAIYFVIHAIKVFLGIDDDR